MSTPTTSPTPPLDAAHRHAAPRVVAGLNQGWRFHRCDDPSSPCAGVDPAQLPDAGAWETVHLPHAVRLEPLNASGGRNFQGVCWYRRSLRADAAWAGRTIYLHLDGLMQVAELWLDGQKLATHHGGYTPLTLDLTGKLRPGAEAELLIRLDNRDDPTVPPGKPQAQVDFCYFGGISRDAWIEACAFVHVSDPILADRVAGGGVLVTFPRVSAEGATVRVSTDLRNAGGDRAAGEVRQELVDASGRTVACSAEAFAIDAGAHAAVVQAFDVARPALWHPEHPNLYTLRTTVQIDGRSVDAVESRVGIRSIRFDKDRGLLLNGEKFLSLGANRHQDHPYVGYALSAAAQWRDAKILRDAGFTSYRSHYPQSTSFMGACDELGILAIVSNPGWQFVGGELFQERALRNARLMVRRDRNRPSVILWEAALNESDNRPLAEALHRAIHEELPGEACYTAGDRNAHFVGPDQHEPTPPSAWDVDYLHNDGTKPYWVREWGDAVDNWSDQQSANRVARGWGEGPMLTQARAHLSRMDELWDAHGGTSTNGGTRLGGATLWAGIDCQRGYHHQPFYGAPISGFRLPKFDYYVFQSQRPPGAGPVVFIANFATFLSPTTVTVFSNCEQVRLVHGDRVVATRAPDAGHRVPHPPFTFAIDRFADEHSTMYMTGVSGPEHAPRPLRAEGLIGGKVVATHVVRPPGVAKMLTLEVADNGRPLVADGADFVRVHARVCDAHGTTCVLADDSVRFDVEGEATVIDGPGVEANPMRADAGIATVLLRATTRAGRVAVTASAFGLKSARATFESVPAPGA